MHRLSLLCVLLVSCPLFAETPSKISFNEQIRPILSEHCFSCHGPDGASRKADLRLDQPTGAIQSRVIVPGKASLSKLIKRIQSKDPDVVMPPPGKGKPLSAQQKQLLRSWINGGAKFEKHWAFITPRRSTPPRAKTAGNWARNAIDLFTLKRMRAIGMSPNKPAEVHTIARRAALDLTGLPPEPAALKSFVGDKQPGAFERYVDQLLGSPHAGEHRARFWLDAARYGDTHGMHVDNYREMWPYRDWVVRAFNRNMPFDRFVVEQIAGDLLPQPTIQQRIATGFSRCNITTSEGGAIPEELNVRYMIDRVETTATVFLGLTAGCAVCHDHKYDPLKQREFYQLGAFFNNTTQPAMDGNQKDTPPVVALPNEKMLPEWKKIHLQRVQLRKQLAGLKTEPAKWWTKRHDHPCREQDLILQYSLTRGEQPALPLQNGVTWADDHPGGKRGVRFSRNGGLIGKMPAVRTDQSLSISFWFRTPDKVLGLNLLDTTSSNAAKKTIGWKVSGNTQGGLSFEMHDGKGNQIRGLLPGDEALERQKWQHVCIRYSGGQSNSSISILVNGRVGRLRNSTEKLIQAAAIPASRLRIGAVLPTSSLSDIRIFRRWLSTEEVSVLARDYQLPAVLTSKKSWTQLTRSQQALLSRFHRAFVDESYKKGLFALSATELRRDFIYSRSTTTMVMQERSTKPHAYVLQRGEYDQRLERVGPGIPAIINFPGTVFAKPKSSRVANRADLARWLVHPNHPLTARVMVNRLWQSVFGVGIVKTSEDFGVMGDPPSHPQLLDWLAVEFVESGWNVNHMLRLMVTSATYRQNAKVTKAELEKDPENRYLARGTRLRLDAEVLRDQVLAVSGLLQPAAGGPSVKPYQPAGLWNVVAITGSNTRSFRKDRGAALYRRSLYTFWKRTSPPPSMAAFNAPTREQCTVRRERTNTPLQALVLMNDPQYVEAARFLAQRTMRKKKSNPDRARWMLTTVLRRPALPADVKDLAAVAFDFEKLFKANPKVAAKLIRTGDTKPNTKLNVATLAAWTMVANTIMNRDDFITK